VVLVGADPASQAYVASKGKAALACGFHSAQHTLPANTAEAELLALIAKLNADPAIHGVLVQLPLPAGLSPARAVEAIAPQKDVDGLHPVNAGLLATGAFERAIVPCTPAGAPHHYTFTLIATDLEPSALQAGLTHEEVIKALEGHAKGATGLIGTRGIRRSVNPSLPSSSDNPTIRFFKASWRSNFLGAGVAFGRLPRGILVVSFGSIELSGSSRAALSSRPGSNSSSINGLLLFLLTQESLNDYSLIGS